MNFLVEDIQEGRNLTDNWVKNQGGMDRWTVSPMYNRLKILSHLYNRFSNLCSILEPNEKPEKYIYPVGVNNDPSNWAGGEHSEYKNPDLFHFLPQYLIDDLKNNKAFLLLDSAFEGYHEQWLFDLFHAKSTEIGFSPKRIIFVTGNSIIEEAYQEWLSNNPQKEHIKVIPYSCFEFDTHLFMNELPDLNKSFPPTFDEHLIHKNRHIDKIKTFCNLNKKPRGHRVNFYALLYMNGLLDNGLVSMNKIDDPTTPITICGERIDESLNREIHDSLPVYIDNISNEIYDPGKYIQRFNNDTTLNTYVSVISEAQYEDHQKTVFLSEKIFKVIACSHPFIVLGNKNSLKELRKLGYQTFSPYIDETYDEKGDCERYQSIINALKKINNEDNKLNWYGQLKEILEFNRNLIRINATERIPYAVLELQNHYHRN